MWRKSDTATLIPRVTPDSVNVIVFHRRMSGAKLKQLKLFTHSCEGVLTD